MEHGQGRLWNQIREREICGWWRDGQTRLWRHGCAQVVLSSLRPAASRHSRAGEGRRYLDRQARLRRAIFNRSETTNHAIAKPIFNVSDHDCFTRTWAIEPPAKPLDSTSNTLRLLAKIYCIYSWPASTTAFPFPYLLDSSGRCASAQSRRATRLFSGRLYSPSSIAWVRRVHPYRDRLRLLAQSL